MTASKSFDPQRPISSLTVTELEALVKQTVRETVQVSQTTLRSAQLDLNAPFDTSVPPFGQIATQHTSLISDELWASVPEDSSEQVKRYLYGS